MRCHSLNGKGGKVGPALDGIATRKSRDYIYESLTEPGAEMAEGYQNQASPMPDMDMLLNDRELAHLMEYLMTLTKNNYLY